MTPRRTFPNRRHSHGGALLPAVFLLLLVASAALATSGHLATQAGHQANERSVSALAQARDALIGYAFSYPESHPDQGIGYLPCPDRTNSGSPLGSCNVRDHGAIGRLPYRTLGLPVLRDRTGQCLWYAVAGSIKNSPKPLVLNWDSPGQFRIVSPFGRAISGAEHDVIAVVLAPGAALPGQIRPSATTAAQSCPGSTSAPDDLPTYLDRPYGTDITGNIDIIHGEPETNINDIAIWITIDELFDALRRRPDFSGMIDGILDTATTALQSRFTNANPDNPDSINTAFLTAQAEAIIGNRAHGRLPNSATLGLTAVEATVHDNWRDQLRFVVCVDGSACLTASLTDSVTSSPVSTIETCRALVLFGGERLRGDTPQRRSTGAERADPGQYLEGMNLTSFTTGTGDYAGYRHYAIANLHRPANEDLIRCVP
jgi:hypothetical protein